MSKPLKRGNNAHRILFDPTSSRAEYVGMNTSKDADTTTTNWDIYRFIYSTTTSKDIVDIRKAGGAWSGRVALLA